MSLKYVDAPAGIAECAQCGYCGKMYAISEGDRRGYRSKHRASRATRGRH